MEQFSLEKWLRDKSRKVVTRDGREVRVLCIDCGVRKSQPILVEITCSRNTKILWFYNTDGTTQDKNLNLFFADEEEKLSEDERIRKVLIGWINLEPSTSFNDTFDGFSKKQILAWLEKQGERNKDIIDEEEQ